jgi:hypothetical protein
VEKIGMQENPSIEVDLLDHFRICRSGETSGDVLKELGKNTG